MLVLLLAACGGGGDADGGVTADAAGDVDATGDPPPALLGQIRALEMTFSGGGSALVDGQLVLAGLPRYHVETMNDGTCRLLEFPETSFCNPPCDTGLCIADECVPYPEYVDAGQLTVTGANAAIAIDPNFCGFSGYGYCDNGVPQDLFDSSDVLTASAPGGDFPAFEVSAGGVAPLVTSSVDGNDDFDMPNGADVEFTWTPTDTDARVRLTINANSTGGHGSPYQAILECDSADDGSLTVPQAMIEAFPETTHWDICAGSDCPLSNAMRYRRGTVAVGDGEVELLVGAWRAFYVIHPAL